MEKEPMNGLLTSTTRKIVVKRHPKTLFDKTEEVAKKAGRKSTKKASPLSWF